MPPGVRQSKRVKAAAPAAEIPHGVSTRSGKQQQTTQQQAANEQQPGEGDQTPQSPLVDWSTRDGEHEGGGAHDDEMAPGTNGGKLLC